MDKVACKTHEDHTLEELEDKETNDFNQKMIEAEEEQTKVDNEDLVLMGNKLNHQLDLPVVTNAPHRTSEDNYTVQLVSKEDQVGKVPHIDFIFGDLPLILEDCMQMVQIQELKHQCVQVRI